MSTTEPAPTREVDGMTIPAAGTFALDPAHSSIGFSVRHLMVAKVRGHFSDFTGTITLAEDPFASSVEVEAQAASVTTGEDQRDGHLKSPDFFDADQYPIITFKSTKVSDHKGEKFVLEGDLTVHGVTKPVRLDAEFAGVAQDPWGGQRIGFSAQTEVDREDFGLTFNQVLETGGVLVGTKAKVEIEAEAVRNT